MTREEAIEILNTYDMSEDNDDTEFKGAIALAIKTLEQESCEPVGNSDKLDCISRQAVLDGIAEWVAGGYADSEADISHISSLVTHLPSVTPAPKMGHWIWCVGSHKCSNCEEYTCFSHKELLRYCPNCGARMEG